MRCYTPSLSFRKEWNCSQTLPVYHHVLHHVLTLILRVSPEYEWSLTHATSCALGYPLRMRNPMSAKSLRDRMAPRGQTRSCTSVSNVCRSWSLHLWGTSGDGKDVTPHPKWYILIRVMRAEKETHHRRPKLITMEHVDSHSSSHYQHGGIQHWVKVSMLSRELNINHHAARRHPLKRRNGNIGVRNIISQ